MTRHRARTPWPRRRRTVMVAVEVVVDTDVRRAALRTAVLCLVLACAACKPPVPATTFTPATGSDGGGDAGGGGGGDGAGGSM
ncbi:MAG TPA: hypothetical protein VKT26_05390 [Acetobacteraceae bacterium]|nr:hypothetical protein [Acetobacteraceae bacterium]